MPASAHPTRRSVPEARSDRPGERQPGAHRDRDHDAREHAPRGRAGDQPARPVRRRVPGERREDAKLERDCAGRLHAALRMPRPSATPAHPATVNDSRAGRVARADEVAIRLDALEAARPPRGRGHPEDRAAATLEPCAQERRSRARPARAAHAGPASRRGRDPRRPPCGRPAGAASSRPPGRCGRRAKRRRGRPCRARPHPPGGSGRGPRAAASPSRRAGGVPSASRHARPSASGCGRPVRPRDTAEATPSRSRPPPRRAAARPRPPRPTPRRRPPASTGSTRGSTSTSWPAPASTVRSTSPNGSRDHEPGRLEPPEPAALERDRDAQPPARVAAHRQRPAEQRLDELAAGRGHDPRRRRQRDRPLALLLDGVRADPALEPGPGGGGEHPNGRSRRDQHQRDARHVQRGRAEQDRGHDQRRAEGERPGDAQHRGPYRAGTRSSASRTIASGGEPTASGASSNR